MPIKRKSIYVLILSILIGSNIYPQKIINMKSNYYVIVGDFIEAGDASDKMHKDMETWELTETTNTPSFNQKTQMNQPVPAANVSLEGIGVEGGDVEIGFQAYYMTVLGEGGGDFQIGSVVLRLGTYLSSRFELGLAPNLSFFSEEVSVNGSLFFQFNFTTASKIVPSISGQWLQYDFNPEDRDFIDCSFIIISLGLQNFFTRYTALNTSVDYGFALTDASAGGVLRVLTGLSCIF